jgi:hypothetical protein
MATNEPVRTHRKVTIGSERNFGIVFAVFFALVALGPAVHGGSTRWWALVVSACFLACAFLAPQLLKPLNLLWFKLGLALHHIINPIVMAVMFYGAILPMAVLLRALGKDLLRLKRDPECTSYWIPRDQPAPASGSMSKQF